MSVTNPDNVVTKQDLANFYQNLLPYLGGMPEIVCNKFNKSDIYSTTEKVVGCSINGKPIYQKTYTGTISSTVNSDTIIDSSFSGKHLIKAEGYVEKDGFIANIPYAYGRVFTPTGQQVMSAAAYKISVLQNASNQLVLSNYVGNTGDNYYGGATYCVTVQYTKTADAANSFNYADESDYSTDEKIVGTWISGEPIYQKTFTGTLPATINDGQRIDIPLGVTVDEVTAIHGSAKWVDGSTGGWSILPFTDGRAIVNNKNQVYFVLYSYGNVISMVIGGTNRTYYHSQPYRLTVQYTKS